MWDDHAEEAPTAEEIAAGVRPTGNGLTSKQEQHSEGGPSRPKAVRRRARQWCPSVPWASSVSGPEWMSTAQLRPHWSLQPRPAAKSQRKLTVWKSSASFGGCGVMYHEAAYTRSASLQSHSRVMGPTSKVAMEYKGLRVACATAPVETGAGPAPEALAVSSTPVPVPVPKTCSGCLCVSGSSHSCFATHHGRTRLRGELHMTATWSPYRPAM